MGKCGACPLQNLVTMLKSRSAKGSSLYIGKTAETDTQRHEEQRGILGLAAMPHLMSGATREAPGKPPTRVWIHKPKASLVTLQTPPGNQQHRGGVGCSTKKYFFYERRKSRTGEGERTRGKWEENKRKVLPGRRAQA